MITNLIKVSTYIFMGIGMVKKSKIILAKQRDKNLFQFSNKIKN